MSKNEEFSTEALSELEKQVSKQLEISENELEQVIELLRNKNLKFIVRHSFVSFVIISMS